MACTSQMARLLGADGAIITKTTQSGANFEDVMLTVQACERRGIKTVLLTPEWGGVDGAELPLVFYVPEAIAMVSTGGTDRLSHLPVPAKVIGVSEGQAAEPMHPGDKPFSPWNELVVERHNITQSIDWWGGMNLTCKEY